jgi:hypothetical protein
MSQWGKLDRVNLPGTATVAQNAANVVFSQSQTANVAIGYALIVANVEYVIANIVSATEVTLEELHESETEDAKTKVILHSNLKNHLEHLEY